MKHETVTESIRQFGDKPTEKIDYEKVELL